MQEILFELYHIFEVKTSLGALRWMLRPAREIQIFLRFSSTFMNLEGYIDGFDDYNSVTTYVLQSRPIF